MKNFIVRYTRRDGSTYESAFSSLQYAKRDADLEKEHRDRYERIEILYRSDESEAIIEAFYF